MLTEYHLPAELNIYFSAASEQVNDASQFSNSLEDSNSHQAATDLASKVCVCVLAPLCSLPRNVMFTCSAVRKLAAFQMHV